MATNIFKLCTKTGNFKPGSYLRQVWHMPKASCLVHPIIDKEIIRIESCLFRIISNVTRTMIFGYKQNTDNIPKRDCFDNHISIKLDSTVLFLQW